MADDIFAQLRGLTGWDQELEDLAVQVGSTNALQVAHDRALTAFFARMQGSSLSSGTIKGGDQRDYSYYPQPDATLYDELRNQLRRALPPKPEFRRD